VGITGCVEIEDLDATAASATTATFTAASDTDFAAGDVLTIVAPTPNDTSLADLGVTSLKRADRGLTQSR
jgi:hypothetical protein